MENTRYVSRPVRGKCYKLLITIWFVVTNQLINTSTSSFSTLDFTLVVAYGYITFDCSTRSTAILEYTESVVPPSHNIVNTHCD